MNDFENSDSKNGFSMKLWRGERMCLLGFDVDQPEADFVGFAIECRAPGAKTYEWKHLLGFGEHPSLRISGGCSDQHARVFSRGVERLANSAT